MSFSIGSRIDKTGPLTGESEVVYRLDRRNPGGEPNALQDSASAVTVTNKLEMNGPKTFTLDAGLVDRRSRILQAGGWNNYASDLVSLSSDFRPFNNAINQRILYTLNSVHSQTTIDVYVPVQAGLGDTSATRSPAIISATTAATMPFAEPRSIPMRSIWTPGPVNFPTAFS